MSTKDDEKKFHDAEQAAKPITADDVVAMAEAAKKSGLTGDKTAAWAAWESLGKKERQLTCRQVAAALGMTKAELAGKAEKGGNSEPEQELVKAHELATETVDGTALATEIADLLAAHLYLPPHAAIAATLWAIHSHASVLDAFDIAPYLNLTSPLRRCGKSAMMDLLEPLCARPVSCTGASGPSLFRLIDSSRPTVLIDEADKVFAKSKDNADLIGTLNAGYRRGGKSLRCVGEDNAVKAFNCFAPYVIAGIGSLPDTMADRSIPIPMQRKPVGHKIQKKGRGWFARAWKLGEREAKWAAYNLDALTNAAFEAERPGFLDDRAADSWAPLFAVAKVLGGDWPKRARDAARALSGGRDANDDTAAGRILADIKAVFYTGRDGRPLTIPHERLATADLLNALKLDLESPWPRWNKGRGLDDRALAKLLKPYGIFSKDLTVASGVKLKGYRREAFTAAWASYVNPDAEPESEPGAQEGEPPPAPHSVRASAIPAKNAENPERGSGSGKAPTAPSFSGDLGSSRAGAARTGAGDERDAQGAFDLPQSRANFDAFRAGRAGAEPEAAPKRSRVEL